MHVNSKGVKQEEEAATRIIVMHGVMHGGRNVGTIRVGKSPKQGLTSVKDNCVCCYRS